MSLRNAICGKRSMLIHCWFNPSSCSMPKSEGFAQLTFARVCLVVVRLQLPNPLNLLYITTYLLVRSYDNKTLLGFPIASRSGPASTCHLQWSPLCLLFLGRNQQVHLLLSLTGLRTKMYWQFRTIPCNVCGVTYTFSCLGPTDVIFIWEGFKWDCDSHSIKMVFYDSLFTFSGTLRKSSNF